MALIKRRILPAYLAGCVMLGLGGCAGSRVVFVPESDGLVRLGPDVQGHVYYWNGSIWERSKDPVTLPEGWYAGSLSAAQDEASEPE